MKTKQHAKWNIRYDEISAEEAAAMRPGTVALEINRMQRMLAELQFLLSCHGEGMELPAELRYEWPSNDYRDEAAGSGGNGGNGGNGTNGGHVVYAMETE